MNEVDVFEHHRICDEFSPVVNGRFVATATLCCSLTSMEQMFGWLKSYVERSHLLFNYQ